MKKLQIDLTAILVLALVVAGAILMWGEYAGIKTLEAQGFWLSVVAVGAIVLAIMVSLDRLARWWDALRTLGRWLDFRKPETAGTTQASILAIGDRNRSEPSLLGPFRQELLQRHGLRWRYRQPWLLLTGDDAAIARLLPELAEQGWLITPDAVLLWSKANKEGWPDADWLKQLYRLRRRRPVDAVILTTDSAADLQTQRRGAHPHGMRLARIAELLRWSAPVYLLDVAEARTVGHGPMPVISCELPRQADADAIDGALRTLRDQLAQRVVAQLMAGNRDRCMGELSQRLDTRGKALADWIAGLGIRQRRRIAVEGIVFAPYPRPVAGDASVQSSIDLPLWHYLGEAARRQPGQRVGWHPVTVASIVGLTAIGLWSAGMLVSGVLNGRDIHAARQSVNDFQSAPNPAARLRALLALQQQIERYEYRTQHHAPLATRFGLNRDPAVLAALWKPYAQASRELLVAPVQRDLEASLVDLAQLRTTVLDETTNRVALSGHQALKTYLMLANPERAEPSFLAPQLVQHWSTDARMTPGERQDVAERLLKFYAEHLNANPANPAGRIEPRPELVAGARQTLLAVIGERNAEDTVYRGVIQAFGEHAGSKYPDQTLAALTAGTDPRGLVRATAIVPGVFTRQAYEGYVASAIEQAARRTEIANDWVLTDGKPPLQTESRSAEALQTALTEQYFADYAEHWQDFMNSLQWEPAPTLPAAIGQLKLMADARQSPVIALMKSLEYQGGAGARKDSLSDTLVAKTQDLLGKKPAGPEVAKPDAAGPLGAAFGPVLRLVAQGQLGSANAGTNAGTSGDLSLQRFLDRATALRLRLQQVGNSADADAQARQMAQALFQGKGSELADTQAYAQLMAASLGSQWAGMGETLFVRPIAQATQTVLQPAQASLNDAWRQSIAMTWSRSFAGRYPFADTANDASLAELARFLRPHSGLIGSFLGTQLAGVLELQGDQWLPAATGGQAQSFDPAFLNAINTLQRMAAHLLAQGEPQYRFEFKPIPTPGLTDTLLTLDGQTLHYYNQRETWQALTWPGKNLQDPGTRLQWQTERAGTSKSYEFGGRWGLVRMLERAHIEPVDSANYQLTWHAKPDALDASEALEGPGAPKATAERQADAHGRTFAEDPDSLTARSAQAPVAADVTYPVRYLMRTEVGQGPLEMLALRGFVLPTRIFVGREPQAAAR
ncbi:ImcF-related family protein [Cupriavidus sp. UME77]|uniref:ImcF-related family protein n=2 Tax=Cupriavidus sp. UME77 TaxID=1862321 RepID=UPI0015FF6018|nr:ImcF-related family protein [Cupriavidus sp. UME77]MBB1634267.1 type VI secretion protein VasK [Cupriavidus sp. UME77]